MTKTKQCRKKVCPFHLLESPRTPFSSLRALDSLSIYPRINSEEGNGELICYQVLFQCSAKSTDINTDRKHLLSAGFFLPAPALPTHPVVRRQQTSAQLSSVQFSRSVVSDSLQPHELQHARPPCPSPTPGVYPNPCPSNR